ncbi:MAG: hypothetical protein V1793_25450 [Pseudomonadota bacterium]
MYTIEGLKTEKEKRGFTARKHLAMAALVMFWSAVLVASSFARDWHELGEMPQVELLKQIQVFENRLESEPGNMELLKALGIAYHALAQENQETFAPKSKAYLDRAFELDRRDYEVMCYLGSITCMMARTTFNPIKKMSFSNEGLALMDKAVTREPNNVSVLMVRGLTQARLPAFFKRKEIAISDFEKVEGILGTQQDGPDTKQDVTPTLRKVYTQLSDLYLETGRKDQADTYMKKQAYLSDGRN